MLGETDSLINSNDKEVSEVPDTLTLKKSLAKITKMALPLSASRTVAMIGTFGSSVILSRISDNARAAGGLITSSQISCLDSSVGALLATGILVSDIGENNLIQLRKIFANSIVFALGLSALSLPFLLTMGKIMNGLGQESGLTDIVQSYYNGFVIGAPATLLLAAAQQFVLGLKYPLPVLLSMIVNSGLAITLSYILTKMGPWSSDASESAFAIGLANSIATIITFFGFLAYLGLSRTYKKMNLFSKPQISKDVLISLVKTGAPIGFQISSELLALTFSTIMAGWRGIEQLQASQAALQYMLVFVIPIIGLSEVAGILTSEYDGKKQYRNGRYIGNTSVLTGALAMLPILAISFGMPKIMSRAFIIERPENDKVIEIAVNLIKINSVGLFFDCIRNICAGNLRGYKNPIFPMLSALLNMVVLGSVLGYVAGFIIGWDAEGIFGARALGMLLGACMVGGKWLYSSNAACYKEHERLYSEATPIRGLGSVNYGAIDMPEPA